MSDASTTDTQPCPKCGFLIGVLAGSQDAICKNCGFKDPCCEEYCAVSILSRISNLTSGNLV